ncbi:hypothetical protein D3C73_661380 [compost metagenome]
MRLVEEQRQQGFVGIAALGQLLEQLGQQPQQERRVDLRRLMDQATGVEQVNASATIGRGLQNVFELQRRLTEQRLGALLLEHGQAPQQCLTRTCGHQRRVVAKQLRVVAQVVEQRLQILQVQQQQAFTVGDLERGVERRLLAVGQLQQRADQ